MEFIQSHAYEKKRIMNPMGIITIVITYIIAQVQANFVNLVSQPYIIEMS